MNNTTATPETNGVSKIAKITSLIANLNAKVGNFLVVDRNGDSVGRVKEVILDSNRQINFIISDDSSEVQTHLFLLKGQLVQKIDQVTHRIILVVEKSQLLHLPEYLEREIEGDVFDNHRADNNTNSVSQPSSGDSHIIDEDIINLLGERLIVDRSKRKIGEVIVRKEIETRMIQIPVRREKLIVEQVSPEQKELASIYLGEEELASVASTSQEMPETVNFEGSLTVSGEFISPKVASLLLNAIALEQNHGVRRIRVTVAVENEQQQQQYQEWFARTSLKGE